MSVLVTLSGHDMRLVDHVRARIKNISKDRLLFASPCEIGAGSESHIHIWILLEPRAPLPETDAAQQVDWTLLGAAWARIIADAGTLVPKVEALDALLAPRIDVLLALLDLPKSPVAVEFHASLRVTDLPRSVAFYAWLLDVWPREWTHRYATFTKDELKLNFVLLVADGKELNHDTLYHVGIALPDKEAVISAFNRAIDFGARVAKPPRTTWRGTPLHELWLEDPDGTLVEIYARLSKEELAEMPVDQEPWFLVPGTAP